MTKMILILSTRLSRMLQQHVQRRNFLLKRGPSNSSQNFLFQLVFLNIYTIREMLDTIRKLFNSIEIVEIVFFIGNLIRSFQYSPGAL